MTTATQRTTPRGAFTLVELLVATALIVFIMVILTEAFSAGIGTFRLLKAQGDLQAKLRNVSGLLVDDLRQAHFDANDKKLSNLFTSPANVPTGGYFYIRQQGSYPEGIDSLGVPSFRMLPAQLPIPPIPTPALCFSVRRNGIQPSDYFVGRGPFPSAPPALTQQGPADYRQTNNLISLWAEVGWFLTPELDGNGQPITTASPGGPPPLPLFTLRRRIRVIIPDDPAPLTTVLNTPPSVPVGQWGPSYAEVSCVPDGQTGFIYFNTPASLATNPGSQAMPQALNPLNVPLGSTTVLNTQGQMDGQPSWFGDDIVLSDVISFNVRILAKDNTGLYATAVPNNGGMLASNQGTQAWSATSAPDFTDVPAANASYVPAPPGPWPYALPQTFPALALGANASYNTGNYSWPVNPPPYTIQALEISIRIWDLKTARSRQITIVQDM